MRLRLLPAVLLLLALPGAVLADILPVGGRPVRCTWWEDGNEVVVNPYNSTNRAMTWGVERYPKSKVNTAKSKSSETPEEEYCRRAFEIREGGAAEHGALAKWCAEQKLKDLAAREWERVLEAEPANEEARKALGPAAVKEILRRNGKANPELGDLLKQYLAADNPATRRVLFERMRKEHDLSMPAYYLERAFRSARRPGGRTDDVSLAFRSNRVKGEEGAKYTIFVPANYDPLRATPLLVGLHGGGRGGKEGDKVVGSGPSAMNFYTGIAESRGWIVLCPTAIQAPWGQEINGEFLDACLLEVQLLYNVDLNRVYLTGHSMGGFGTWFWGPKWAERWAAIAPMAGGGGPAAARLRETQTFCFIFHGADDNVVGVQDDRSSAKSLLDGGNDFAYTELNNVGHGFPQEVAEEMAAHFERKRLAIGRGRSFRRSDEVRSSFLEKPGPEEKRYLGDPEPPDPGAKPETAEGKRKRLLADVLLGGGKAEAAAAAFLEFRDAESVKALAPHLVNPKSPDDVRSAAARALGNIGLPECVPHLEKGLADDNDAVFHAAAAGLVAVGDRKAGPALLKALDLQAKRFADRFQGAVIDFSDFDPRCAALGAAARAAAALCEPGEAVARIRDRVIRTVYEGTFRVQATARAGEDPAAIRERLAKEVCAALAKTGHPSARDVLLHLKEIGRAEGGIVSACDEALTGLAAGGQ